VADHPEWFFHRPDGTIKYAENPPKKYEDVYPLDYHNASWQELWNELRDVILWWAERGVRTFRVDNPHTKPVSFWEWLIAETRGNFPDLVFLSEAFTKPKMMRVLAKAGFSQSYTYFTWRNTKQELTEYLSELSAPWSADYFRPNFFANTPDILPFFLQQDGRAPFMIRAVLAATLSPLYGIYSGFELCENAPVPGKEEYLDSEKYQFKQRDWNAPGNIKALITRLNAARHGNPALQHLTNLRFHIAENDQVLFFAKATADNVILVAVNLDPQHLQLPPASATFHGRDILGPVAGGLSGGRYGFSALGARIADPVRLPGLFDGPPRILHVDGYGNLVTNLPADGPAPTRFELGGRPIAVHRTYGDVAPGELLALVGSYGLWEIAQHGGSAAAALGVGRDVPVLVR
jgi:glycosidase